ncbi:MAG: transketolase [Deltaproteobacteria bacterium]|nr:transketolase [Deltaproteobacteria bacterium]
MQKLQLEQLKRLATTVRMLSVDAIEKANSGHPGLPMGAADYATVLWANYLRFNPKDPSWANRDRFVLSAGHGCMLWYSLLNLFGYDVPMSALQSFRQWESITPGHPEFGMTPGVETTTGPLGQGFANGVGIALSGKMFGERYSKELFNYRVYGLVSDGDLMEGVAAEAASLAGHLGLNNLVYLYDDNHISLAGGTDVCFTESVPKRFESYGWFAQSVDGHDMTAFQACLEKAIAEPSRPSIICCRTTLGFGSPHKANTHEAHGSPLGADEVKATKKNLGWPEQPPFLVPDDVKDFLGSLVAEKTKVYSKWQSDFESWSKANPEKGKHYCNQLSREIPVTLKDNLIAAFSDNKKDATRNLSGKALQVIAKEVPFLVGGSADLDPSTKTYLKDCGDVKTGSFAGRNIHFGVREHAMGSIANGLAYCQAWLPYTATFLVFSDYMRPPMRLAAISHLQSLFLFTHDSFWVGEDGPTHEPIEHYMALRAIPKLNVFRPADGLEVGMCYYAAITKKNGPSALLFTRQNIMPFERPKSFKPDDILKGGYVAYGAECQSLVIVATGSEVGLACEAAKILEQKGTKVRVVSLPSWELFGAQDKSYRDSVIPPQAKKVSLEAGITLGWERMVGADGLLIGLDHYGASAPGEVVAEKFGFTPAAVATKIAGWLK